MTEPGPLEPTRPAIFRRGLKTMAVCYLVAVLTSVLVILLFPDENRLGVCEGIGFGCSPAPRDWAVLLIAIYGPSLAVVSVLTSFMALAIRARAGIRSDRSAGVLATVIGIVAAAGLGFLTLAS